MDSDADDASSEDLHARRKSGVSPDVVRSYRHQLTPGEDVIDTATWAGSVPQVNGIAPRVRLGRNRWFNLLWLLPIGFFCCLSWSRSRHPQPQVRVHLDRSHTLPRENKGTAEHETRADLSVMGALLWFDWSGRPLR